MSSQIQKPKLEYIVIYKLMCGHNRVVFRSGYDSLYNKQEDMFCASCTKVSDVNSISITRNEIISQLVNIFDAFYYTRLITPVTSLFAH